MIKKIISGGQTGADRAALDFAIKYGIDYGGWIPKGRLAEDGPIADSYSNLIETVSNRYPERTKRNIEYSDGTLIVSHGRLTGGSLLTSQIALKLKKPLVHADLHGHEIQTAAWNIKRWIQKNGIEILNIAGSRASGNPAIYDKTLSLLTLICD